jgi:serine/threonine protein kinase
MHKKVGPYKLISKIGNGAFGTVFMGKHIPSKNKIAVKMINRKNLTNEHLLRLELEISCQRSVDCENVVKLLDCQKTEHNFYLILEYCKGGDLGNFLKKNGPIDEPICQKWMHQLVTAFKAMREKNIIHRDLKLQNILMTEPSTQAVLKIADFGMSRFVDQDELAKSWLGSPLYMAPEMFKVVDGYDSKADIWSLGVVFYEMLTGEPPIAARRKEDIPQAQLNLRPIPHHLSTTCQDLLSKMLEHDPKKRISFEDLFEHPFILGTISDELSIKASKGSSDATISSDMPNIAVPVANHGEHLEQIAPVSPGPVPCLERQSSAEDFIFLDNDDSGGEFVFLTKNDHPAVNLGEMSKSVEDMLGAANFIIKLGEKVYQSDELLGSFTLFVKACCLIAEAFEVCESLIKKHQLLSDSHPAFFKLFSRVKCYFLEYEEKTERLAHQVETVLTTSDLARLTLLDSVGNQGVADSLIYNYVVNLCKEAAQDEFLREYASSKERYSEAMMLLDILCKDKPEDVNNDWEVVVNFRNETSKRLEAVKGKSIGSIM